MTGDGTTENTMESGITDITSEFSGQGGGALSAKFWVADPAETAYSTVAHEINGLVAEANFPLGQATTGNEIEVTALTFNGKTIDDPNSVLGSIGTLENMAVSAIEIDHSGGASNPLIDLSQPAVNEEVFETTFAQPA